MVCVGSFKKINKKSNRSRKEQKIFLQTLSFKLKSTLIFALFQIASFQLAVRFIENRQDIIFTSKIKHEFVY